MANVYGVILRHSAQGFLMNDTKRVMEKVARKAEEHGLSNSEVAKQVGVTMGSFLRHLRGAYVRSDSLAKYRRWLSGDVRSGVVSPAESLNRATSTSAKEPSEIEPLRSPKTKPFRPYRVVDLFGGCGGLSLGFELASGGDVFRTVLAVDIEEPMVRVFNANHPSSQPRRATGRRADLAEFMNEAEVLAYYLEHLSALEADSDLDAALNKIRPFSLKAFIHEIRNCDDQFVRVIAKSRSRDLYLDAYAEVDKVSLSQTSVLGFHSALKLPRPGAGTPNFDPPLWGGESSPQQESDHRECLNLPHSLLREARRDAELLWHNEIEKLRERATGSGKGQLASAAKKILEALGLINGPAYLDERAAWLDWRTRRDALRRYYFEDEGLHGQLRHIYQANRGVDVLLGGPPCQGFSRIGRGKIRSLREQSVHVQTDSRAGDQRNELMHKYVLFVAALSPSVFLFENVRHFQAVVKTPDGTFSATQVLAEAIENISHDGLEYSVASKILVASDHMVPQTRERFFMIGVRKDITLRMGHEWQPDSCLSLPSHSPLPLKMALAGLPEPLYASDTPGRSGKTSDRLRVDDFHVRSNGPKAEYVNWIRQLPPNSRPNHTHFTVDGHCTRDSRRDDRSFFEMLGPGKRWMDYRCDGDDLVKDLTTLVEWALSRLKAGEQAGGLTVPRIREILSSLDGSLSIRLLLDSIPLTPGEERHHLSSTNYLNKREGNHGDWLARLDAEAPAKTMVSHMGKDAYAYIHPSAPRTISVREAARVQTFPDWFNFGAVGLVDAYRMIGNAVPPLLSSQLALRVAVVLEKASAKSLLSEAQEATKFSRARARQPALPGLS